MPCEGNWPLLTTRKSFFDTTASGGGGNSMAAAVEEPDAVGDTDAWGDDADMNLDEGNILYRYADKCGSTIHVDNSLNAGYRIPKHLVILLFTVYGIGGKDEFVDDEDAAVEDGEGGGWDIGDEDLELPPDLVCI